MKAGDRLLQMDAFAPTRDQLWKAKYLYYVLSPRRSLKIVIQSPGGPPRPIEVAAKVTPKPKDVTVSLDPLLEGGIMPFEDDSVVRSNRLVRLVTSPSGSSPRSRSDPRTSTRSSTRSSTAPAHW